MMNIGKEFKYQMQCWLKDRPEVIHYWEANQLKIYYPKENDKFITFQFDTKSIRIDNGKEQKIFRRKLFKFIDLQVNDIMVFWRNEMLSKSDTEIKKPKLKKNQVAVSFSNSKYGHVLTVNKNIFTGWGEIYQIFETEDEAMRLLENELKNDKFEIYFYNSEYELIKVER